MRIVQLPRQAGKTYMLASALVDSLEAVGMAAKVAVLVLDEPRRRDFLAMVEQIHEARNGSWPDHDERRWYVESVVTVDTLDRLHTRFVHRVHVDQADDVLRRLLRQHGLGMLTFGPDFD